MVLGPTEKIARAELHKCLKSKLQGKNSKYLVVDVYPVSLSMAYNYTNSCLN